MFREHRAAGALTLGVAFATAMLSGSSCAINEIGMGGGGAGSGDIPAACADSVMGEDETDIDCGGSCAVACGDGKACKVGTDCASGRCVKSQCVSCSDATTNDDETDVDCGGSCGATCEEGHACMGNADCASSRCVGSKCVSCSNATTDGDETDVDCGGTCPVACEDKKTCKANSDCQSGVCLTAVCQISTCNDNVHNGSEADIDCAGSCLTKCSVGRNCTAHEDCISGFCAGSFCSPDPMSAVCFNSTQDIPETDIDCGGGACPSCAADQTCLHDSDCRKTLKCKDVSGVKTCQMP